jgi:membrane associated rhomboid family serine protease
MNELDKYFDEFNKKVEEPKGFEYLLGWIKTYPMTALLFLISISLFISVSYYETFEYSKYPSYVAEYLAIIKTGGVLGGPAQVLIWEGDIWRIFVNLFHHGNLMHIFFNLYALYIFGSFSELFLGKFKYLIFIILCGLFQQISCQLTIEPGAIGLSGIIFGLFGFLWMIKPLDPTIEKFMRPELIKLMLVQLVIFIPLTYFNFINIANVGHISGLVYGVLFGYIFFRKPTPLLLTILVLSHILILPSLFYIYKPIYNPEWKKWSQQKHY